MIELSLLVAAFLAAAYVVLLVASHVRASYWRRRLNRAQTALTTAYGNIIAYRQEIELAERFCREHEEGKIKTKALAPS